MVRADAPAALDGRDLAPLWWEAASDSPERLAERPSAAFRKRFLYGEASGGVTYDQMLGKGIFPVYRSVRQGRYKLIHESKHDRYQLFDLESDPLEQVDVSREHPEVAKALTDRMRRRYEDSAGVAERAESGSSHRVELDAEEIERLRALGYVP